MSTRFPAEYGFSTGDVIFSVDLQTAFGLGFGIHGVMVDGVEVHSPGLATGACCLGDGSCLELENEDACLSHDPPGTWGGAFSNCSADVNTNGRPDACEACTTHDPFADTDGDLDVDQADFSVFQACYTGEIGIFDPVLCDCLDTNADHLINQEDLLVFDSCASGPGVPADPQCDD